VWVNGGCGDLDCTSNSSNNFAGGVNSTDSISCNCNTGYVWDVTGPICKRDCSAAATPNSNGTNFEFLSCECNVGYHWDYTLVACVPYQNCNGIPNSSGSNVDSNTCFCNSGYYWSAGSAACSLNQVTIVTNNNYTMGVGQFVNGTVSFVNADTIGQHFVASDLSTIRFFPDNNGVYDNTSAYNVNFTENIPQMRFRSDGSWLAVRGSTTTQIYFMKQAPTNYAVDHTVNVGSRPLTLVWVYNQNTLAVGLANGNIAVLQRNIFIN
jgi:hypothetical protein